MAVCWANRYVIIGRNKVNIVFLFLLNFKYMAKSKYFGTTVTNQHWKNWGQIKFGNFSYSSSQNIFFSSRRISKNINTKTHINAVFPIVLYWNEIYLTWRKEHRLWAIENRAERRVFGPKRGEVALYWRKLHTEDLRNCTLLNINKDLPRTGYEDPEGE